MERYIHTLPLNEVENKVKQNIEERKAYLENEYKETLERISSTRQAMMILDGAGIPLQIYSWQARSIEVELGERLTKAQAKHVGNQLVLIRKLLGKMKLSNKEAHDAKKRLIKVTMECEDYPGVLVSYIQRLPKGARCKIVKHKSVYSTLMCDM